MNLKKLLSRNMARPINERLAVSDIQDAVSVARVRGDMAALIAEIDRSPSMIFKRKWDAFINSGHSTFQDFVTLVEGNEVETPIAVRPALPSNVPMPANVCLNPRIKL